MPMPENYDPVGRQQALSDRQARRETEQAKLYTKKPERESTFNEAEFACQLSDYRFRRDGSILIQLVVPHRYRQQALDLSDAYGVMLLISAERYKNRDATRTS